MSDLNFTVNADTSRARSNLEQLERRVGSVSESFGRLKTAIGGLVAAAAVRSLFQMSNALADLSASTNISIQSIAGLGEALAQNSGSFDQANNVILRFTETLGQAFEGSSKTQEAFARVGVTLQDLRTLSEQDLLRKTILGLGQVSDTGTRAALSAELFGRTLRGADLEGVARDLDAITSQQREFAIAAERAGAVNQSLSNSFRQFQNQLLIALQPIAELAEKLTESTERIREFISVSLEILKWAAIAAGILAGGKALVALGTAAFSAYKVISLLGTSVIGLFRALSSPLTRGNLIKNLEMIPGIGSKATTMLKAMGVPLEFIKNNFGKLTTAIGGAIGAFLGLKKVSEERPLREMDKELDEITRQFDELTAQQEERRRVEDAINESLIRQQQTLRDSIGIYARSNQEVQRRLRQEIELIGLSEQQKTVRQALFSLEDSYLREVTRLTDLYAQKSRSSKEEDQKMLPEIQKALQDVTAEYEAQIGPVMRLTQEKLRALAAEEQRLEIEKQIQNLSQFTNRTRFDTERKIRDIQAEIAKSTMPEIEKKYFDIARAAEESARSAIEAENERRRAINQPLLTNDEQQQYYEAALEGNQRLIDATRKHFEQSRSWSTGWKKAFNDYVDNATNASRQAQRVFERATKGMEDAIVNFAKTGKFEFKSFVNMILEELLRSQIQQLIASIFSARSSSGASSLTGRLLGFASGGIIPHNGPVIVGERGPEIISGASGRVVTPNNQLGNTNVTYNINAVDALSFKQLIARDPTFIHAVAEQGRRTLPQTRR